jgi:Mg-chelatase subunit ChlD
VDDEYDSSLCSATTSALLQQSASTGGPEDSLDAFLAELDAAAPAPELSKDTPAFLKVLAHKPNQKGMANFMTRDYTLIIDRSGSMGHTERVHVPMKTAEKLHKNAGVHSLSRWAQVDAALQYLVPYVVAEDPDGIGVYFFDSRWDEAPNVCSENQVHQLFQRNRPGGGTYLADVLKEAMEPDTVGRAETIFILTDGQASDPNYVSRAIIDYTKKMCKPEMLSISFIQVGTDGGAQDYLNSLDDDLEHRGAKFDIVDAMTKDEMEGKSFLDVVELSVHD